jgi:hypothetical protein
LRGGENFNGESNSRQIRMRPEQVWKWWGQIWKSTNPGLPGNVSHQEKEKENKINTHTYFKK